MLQLFRRVAAALPGMEQTEQKKEDSILSVSLTLLWPCRCCNLPETVCPVRLLMLL